MADIAPGLACTERQHQGAEIRAGAAGRGEAGDDDFLTPRSLDFEPVAGARAREVLAAATFGHDALETAIERLLEEAQAVLGQVPAEGEQRVSWQESAQARFALQQAK